MGGLFCRDSEPRKPLRNDSTRQVRVMNWPAAPDRWVASGMRTSSRSCSANSSPSHPTPRPNLKRTDCFPRHKKQGQKLSIRPTQGLHKIDAMHVSIWRINLWI